MLNFSEFFNKRKEKEQQLENSGVLNGSSSLSTVLSSYKDHETKCNNFISNLDSDPYCKLFHKLTHSCFLDSRYVDP